MIRILHVDDEKTEHLLLKLNMKAVADDLELHWVETGQSALKLLEDESFDCILSDYQMPGMDGLQLLVALNEQGNDTPFIFRTGQGSEELAAQALRAGADDYYSKDVGIAHYERLTNSIFRVVRAHKERDKRQEIEETLFNIEERYLDLASKSGPVKFDELVDVEKLQELMDIFYRMNGHPFAIIDLDNVIHVAAGWQDVCTKFHRVHPEAEKLCFESDQYITKHLSDEEPAMYTCKHGLTDSAVPIIISGNHIATLFTGQFFLEDKPIDEEFFHKQAEEYDFDEERYLEAVRKVPCFSREKVEEMLLFSSKFVQLLTTIGTVNSRFASELLSRKRADEALAKSEERLVEAQKVARLGYYVLDISKGLWTNSAELDDIFGINDNYTRDVAGWMEIVHPDFRETMLNHLQDEVLGQHKKFDKQYKIINLKTRKEKWVHGLGHLLLDENNDPVEMFGTIQDISERKEVELQLKANEEKYKAIFDQGISPIALLEQETLKILDANEATSRVYGYSKDELIGNSALMLSAEEEKSKLAINDAVEKGRVTVPFRWHKRKDGSIFPVELSIVPIDLQGEACVFAVSNDISERYAAQSQLHILSRAVEQNPASIVITDLEGRIEYVNPKFTELTGYTLEESLKQNPRILKSGTQTDSFYKELWETVIRGDDWRGEIHNKKKNGEFYWEFASISPVRNSQGEITHFVAVKEDITERKQIEEALQESENRLRATFEQAAVGIAHLNTNGRWIRVNQKLCEITGFSEEELLQLTFKDITHPDDIEADMVFSNQLLAGKIDYYSLEKRYIKKSSEVIWIRLTTNLVKSKKDKIDYIATVIEDISDRKLTEESLSVAHVKLEDANRELESFSYSVSHDLRAPLRQMSGFSRLLANKHSGSLNEDGKELLEEILNAGDHMMELIDSILKLSRVQQKELKLRNVDLCEVCKRAADKLRISEPIREVELKMPKTMPAEVDEKLLEIVFDNLLGNAWKFTGKKEKAEIEFGIADIDGKQTYFIKDNGAGFDQENAEMLFAPFQRLHLKTEFDGTGIGLATVQRIIHRHGGKIWATSELEKGATFFFTLGD